MKDKQNIFRIVNKVQKESKDVEQYHTGLLGESMIVSAYQTMPLDKLEKMRFIINKIIKKKKEFKRVAQSGHADTVVSSDTSR